MFFDAQRPAGHSGVSGRSANVEAPGAGWSVAQNYSYDKLNRVLSAEEPSITGGQGWKRSYNYDRWGNQWVDATNSSGINVYSVTPTGSAWITPKNRINLSAGSYDRAGNQISLPPYSAAYDADNRLTTMSGTLAYAYDGEGRRVKKVNESLTTRYVYDAFGKLAAEYAVGTAPSGAPQSECSTCYLTVDHLGSTRVLWDPAGVKGRYDYMPFGDAIPSDRNKRDSAGSLYIQ
jgi:YD repeat-containing protein